MAGALLRSGTLQEFRPLGVDGQPVHGAARQLREAVRLQMGTMAADCLAIPQPSQNGERIDWYAPVEGDVVPWSAATEEERASALTQLEELHARLRQTANNLYGTVDTGQHQTDQRDKQVFARLLDKSIHFPGSEHVYLVAGKPVVTFWGFTDRNSLQTDPLLCLRPPAALPVVPAAVTPTTPTALVTPITVNHRRRPWWWWLLWLLLLLLLLWLLLFALRACAPQARLPFGLGSLDLPLLPAPERKVMDGRILIPSGAMGGTGSAGRISNHSDPDMTLVHGEDHADILPDEGTAGADAIQDHGNPGQDTGTDDPLSNEQAPPSPGASPELDNPSDQRPSEASDPTSSTPLPPELNIPSEAIATGSTGFLNGHWRAGAGIQDAQTGKPLRLDYRFSDGQGQVRVERGDGVACSGEVHATMQDGHLTLNSQHPARCDDGGSYRLPEVRCQPGAQSATDCRGHYQNQQFPMSMRQADP